MRRRVVSMATTKGGADVVTWSLRSAGRSACDASCVLEVLETLDDKLSTTTMRSY